jgi:hypothetical protein
MRAYEPTTAVVRPKARIGIGKVASRVEGTASRHEERFEEF